MVSVIDETTAGYIELEDGTRFCGRVFGCQEDTDGEVVFNTGMVGYVEGLTDPSYRGQILVLTYPLIGNYGVPEKSSSFESDKIQIRGLVVSSLIESKFHWNAGQTLGEWMNKEGIIGISGIDTRQLTKILREKGTMLGKIVVGEKGSTFNVTDPNESNLVKEVSTDKILEFGRLENPNQKHVLVVDLGCKRSIVNELVKRGCRVTSVPFDCDFSGMECDGILLSNGPGDPIKCGTTVKSLKTVLEQEKIIPVAGICLGTQIMALAAGAKTYKLRYGHRSQNQPCQEIGTKKCVVTSQNHGYAIDIKSIPKDWEVWYTNLNDGTVEGIRHKTKPFFSVQFHPEASPGPVDSKTFFDLFIEVMRSG